MKKRLRTQLEDIQKNGALKAAPNLNTISTDIGRSPFIISYFYFRYLSGPAEICEDEGKIMQEHDDRLGTVSARVKWFYDRNQRYRIYHGSTSTTRSTRLSRDSVVDTSGMNHILTIDADERIALVEPNVSMELLVDSTLELGLVPPVVMEFPGITVGEQKPYPCPRQLLILL